MKKPCQGYDPAVHHRRSIRMKGHDYAGGGMYFVTICAHRDAGDIFAAESVKAMVGRVWEELPGAGAGLVSAATERNAFVLRAADRLWLPYVSPGGMLARLIGPVNTAPDPPIGRASRWRTH